MQKWLQRLPAMDRIRQGHADAKLVIAHNRKPHATSMRQLGHRRSRRRLKSFLRFTIT